MAYYDSVYEGQELSHRAKAVYHLTSKNFCTLLTESVVSRMRELAMRCRVVEVSVRDVNLFSFTRQRKLPNPTCSSHEIANVAFDQFKHNYRWQKPIRSMGVRGSELVDASAGTQLSFMNGSRTTERTTETGLFRTLGKGK